MRLVASETRLSTGELAIGKEHENKTRLNAVTWCFLISRPLWAATIEQGMRLFNQEEYKQA